MYSVIWFISNDPDLPLDEWTELETTTFPLYVLHKEPISESTNNFQPTEAFNSVINLSCRGANQKESDIVIVESIWNELFNGNFSIKLPKINGEESTFSLEYRHTNSCVETHVLLEIHRGQCKAFANLFRDLIRIQGIAGGKEEKIVWEDEGLFNDPDGMFEQMQSDVAAFFADVSEEIPVVWKTGPPGALFLINNYDLNEDDSGLIFLNERFHFPDEAPLYYTDGGSSIPIEYKEKHGIPGIGVDNPRSKFSEHMIFIFNNTLYDPSYSKTFSSLEDFDANSIAAFGSEVTIVGSGGSTLDLVWVYEYNNSEINVKFEE